MKPCRAGAWHSTAQRSTAPGPPLCEHLIVVEQQLPTLGKGEGSSEGDAQHMSVADMMHGHDPHELAPTQVPAQIAPTQVPHSSQRLNPPCRWAQT